MPRPLVECVPNFSEGRDAVKVDAIVAEILSVPGVILLDREMDADHNRSVVTFAAPAEAVVDAALRGVAKAVELIDLNGHSGVHPRIGAADVVPFVPLEGVTLEQCVTLARRAGQEIWDRLRVPVYFYEAAARRADNVNLENIRKGQFEGLREEVRTNPDRAPDIGGPDLHATAGAVAVGARKFLIAYNVNLNTPDVEVAKKIAKAIRFSSGGFRYVKSMGVPITSRKLAQVSINLTDFEQTPLHRVFESVRLEAARYGVSVAGSEIVGLIPKKALEMAADHFLRCENFHPNLVLENRLADAAAGAGLRDFIDALAAPKATPGGGSAAAAAGAMSAALGSMVAGLSKLSREEFEADRRYLLEAVDRDSEAYQSVLAAYRRPRETREPFVEQALQAAATVPLEVMERVEQVKLRLADLERQAPAKFASDVETAKALATAASLGCLSNVNINIGLIKDQDFIRGARARLEALQAAR